MFFVWVCRRRGLIRYIQGIIICTQCKYIEEPPAILIAIGIVIYGLLSMISGGVLCDVLRVSVGVP